GLEKPSSERHRDAHDVLALNEKELSYYRCVGSQVGARRNLSAPLVRLVDTLRWGRLPFWAAIVVRRKICSGKGLSREFAPKSKVRTGGRVAEGTGLENRHTGEPGIVSSNLTLSVGAPSGRDR